MAITASMVKELRERTGAGMMDCKKMLVEADGNMDTAIELMRKSGAAKADKKASRVAAEGRIIIDISGSNGAILEVNSETDFVAKDDSFLNFANSVMAGILADQPADIQALSALPLENGETVEEMRANLVAKIGENIQVRRFESLSNSGGLLAFYLHGERIGVLISLTGGNEQLGKDIAMHIAASNPQYIKEDDVAEDVLAKEKEILIAQAEGSGKSMAIIEKMVAGRLRKYLAEITLLGQPFVKNPDQTVSQLLADAGASVDYFIRYEVGEGIEKKQEDFAAEVAAQIKGG